MADNFRIYAPNAPGNPLGGNHRALGHQAAQAELAHLRAELDSARAFFDQLKAEPTLVASVVEVRGERMTIAIGPSTLDVAALEGTRVGERVLCNRNSYQALERIPDQVPVGIVVTASRHDGELVESEIQQVVRVFRCTIPNQIRKGERVIVDPSMTYVIGSLGMPPQTFAIGERVSVGWDEIGGQLEAKDALREAIELPFQHPELFRAYGKRHIRGVLLHGPSGTGKTLLAKAAATALARVHGHAIADGFAYVKGPELLNAYIGKSEENVRRLFEGAREHKRTKGYPAVIFIDECDALLGQRSAGSTVSMSQTVVPQFLSEMDGLDDHAALFILATNRPDMLDPAVVRQGRIDRRVRVGRPSKADAVAIAAIHLKGKPLGEVALGDPIALLARATIDEICADRHIVRSYGERTFRLRDFLSGALIAGIIERAAALAIADDIAHGVTEPTGITGEFLTRATERECDALRDVSHDEAFQEALTTLEQGTR